MQRQSRCITQQTSLFILLTNILPTFVKYTPGTVRICEIMNYGINS
jgi:hypothetical protein